MHGKAARRARNGTYQRPGQPVRRQRYRCWPHTPDPDFPKGFLVQHVTARPAVAAHVAWLVVSNISDSRPHDADQLAALVAQLGLAEPRLLRRQARAVANTGDLAAAISLLTAGLASHGGSSDRARSDLTAYRDAVAVRQATAQRIRPERPHRRGHPAPATRPARRRFTASPLR